MATAQKRFSKAVSKGGKENQMRDSDKRKFRETLSKLYRDLGAEQLDELVPKDSAILVAKLLPKDELITRGSDPIFFTDRSSMSKDDFIPTCYALHCAPQALCRVVIVHPGLEKQICRGADLFIPGVAKPADEEFSPHIPWPNILFRGKVKQGELCCLVSSAKPWAPYAVGRIHRSTEDFVMAGMQGIAVEVIHHEGDALWDSGSKKQPSSSPPATLLSALAEKQKKEADMAERAIEREAAAATAKRLARLEEIPRLIRKVDKSLRQVKELVEKEKAGVKLDNAQKDKAGKEHMLMEEKIALEAELALAHSVCDVPKEHQGGVVEGTSDISESSINYDSGAAAESVEKEQEEQDEEEKEQDINESKIGDNFNDSVSGGGGGGGGSTIEEQSGEEVETRADDMVFLSAFLTELTLQTPSLSAPLLISTVFGKSSTRAGGIGVKQTSWKSSSKFLEALPEGTVTLKEMPVSKGKSKGKKGGEAPTEIIGFNSGNAPQFTMMDLPVAPSEKTRVIATKKGAKQVIVSGRKVRNNNITVIDGLEDWGIDKKEMEVLASELRKIFSVSASVVERSGTADNTAKQLWSVQLGGKFVDQIAAELKGRGISRISTSAKKGMITKQDKQQFKNHYS